MSTTLARSSGLDGDGTWAPAFPGQRRPFTSGHRLSMTHGARSERTWRPIADRIEAELLAGPMPGYLRDVGYRPLVRRLAEAYAKERLLGAWLAETGIQEAMTAADLAEWQPGAARRGAMMQRRLHAATGEWLRIGREASRLAGQLGLTPASCHDLGLPLGGSPPSVHGSSSGMPGGGPAGRDDGRHEAEQAKPERRPGIRAVNP